MLFSIYSSIFFGVLCLVVISSFVEHFIGKFRNLNKVYVENEICSNNNNNNDVEDPKQNVDKNKKATKNQGKHSLLK